MAFQPCGLINQCWYRRKLVNLKTYTLKNNFNFRLYITKNEYLLPKKKTKKQPKIGKIPQSVIVKINISE